MSPALSLLVQTGAGAGALLAIIGILRGFWRMNKRLVMISNAVAELMPNGGKSIKDRVTSIDTRVASLDSRVEKLERRRLPWPL